MSSPKYMNSLYCGNIGHSPDYDISIQQILAGYFFTTSTDSFNHKSSCKELEEREKKLLPNAFAALSGNTLLKSA